MSSRERFSYKAVGVDRNARKILRSSLTRSLGSNFRYGDPVELPFGNVYPTYRSSARYFDFQIEGVGTKTLLAELANDYTTIGIDGVAMVANDICRSGADTVLLSDAIHIARSERKIVRDIVKGVQKGAELCGATLASGETGDVAEILHPRISNRSLPFDLIVSGLGLVDRNHIVWGNVNPGDAIIGIESSGIHSNGVTLARKILLKEWGGRFDANDIPEILGKPVLKELLTPTRIYAQAISEIRNKIEIGATLHITGDGFAKFSRLTEFQKIRTNRTGPSNHSSRGFEFDNLGDPPPIFKLILQAAKEMGKALSLKEMFRTFNMGFGFAFIVDKKSSDEALELSARHFPAKVIGHVTNRPGVVVVDYQGRMKKIVF
jgi:phosphoribosylformylglycinamidine cyclo-ligase